MWKPVLIAVAVTLVVLAIAMRVAPARKALGA